MLTQNQQQTIQFLTEQFEKLNGSTQPNKKFNLVDIKPLEDKAERIRQLDEEEKIQYQIWTDAQKSELQRIADLLREDLPEDRTIIEVNTYGCVLSICRIQFLSSGQPYINDHPESCVKISVEKKRNNYKDEYSQKYRNEYTHLYYTLNYGKVEYSTIEELVSTDEFKDTLRTRVL